MATTKTSKPQVLTLEGVKRAARRAYRNRALTAQHPKREKRQCVYVVPGRTKDYHCAIGAVLTETTLKRIVSAGKNKGTAVCALPDGVIHIDNNDDFKSIAKIQCTHDEWAASQRGNEHKITIATHKRAFLATIGITP